MVWIKLNWGIDLGSNNKQQILHKFNVDEYLVITT